MRIWLSIPIALVLLSALAHADRPAFPEPSAPAVEPVSPPVAPAPVSPTVAPAPAPVGPAGATPYAKPPPPLYTTPPPDSTSLFRDRRSWFFGGDLGTGVVSYNSATATGESYGSTFFAARFGGMLSQRFALSAELWVDSHSVGSSTTVAQACFGLAVTHWLLPRFWLKAGLGTATMRVDEGADGDADDSDDSGVLMLGAGYEALSRDKYALNLSVNFFRTGYDRIDDLQRTSFGLLNVGLNWH